MPHSDYVTFLDNFCNFSHSYTKHSKTQWALGAQVPQIMANL